MPQAKKNIQKAVKSANTKQSEVEVKVEDDVKVEETVDQKKTRKVIDKESIMQSYDTLIQMIDNEIDSIRENSTGTKNLKGVKFLRTVNKNLKTLKLHSGRVMKNKKKTTERTNTQNSGFLKKVSISKELAAFTGWDEDTLASRVEVTKFICDYIKDNNLQNPKDRRQINPDTKLQKLLKISSKSKEPLKYYSIQTHLKPHFC